MERQFSNIILLDNAQQYNDLLEGKSVTLASGAVLTELDKNAEYKVPASKLYRYHISIEYSTNQETYEFDVLSSSSDLFAGATTDAQKYKIVGTLYNSQNISVVVIKDNWSAFGCAVMTLLPEEFVVLGFIARLDGSTVFVNTAVQNLNNITFSYTKTQI